MKQLRLSDTSTCRPDSVPIRLFRIQGKKGVVQAAVHLIEQAVAKYKDLCDCKRRGEFVQREHIINKVEFYYQPPPRKAFATPADEPPGSTGNCCNSGGKQLAGGSEVVAHGSGQACNGQVGGAPAQQLPFAPHHVWLQHLQQQHQAQAAAAQQHKQAQAAAIHHEANQVYIIKTPAISATKRTSYNYMPCPSLETTIDHLSLYNFEVDLHSRIQGKYIPKGLLSYESN